MILIGQLCLIVGAGIATLIFVSANQAKRRQQEVPVKSKKKSF